MRAQHTLANHLERAITQRAKAGAPETRVTLGEVECEQVGFAERVMRAGRNNVIGLAAFRGSGRSLCMMMRVLREHVGLGKPFDPGGAFIQCHRDFSSFSVRLLFKTPLYGLVLIF